MKDLMLKESLAVWAVILTLLFALAAWAEAQRTPCPCKATGLCALAPERAARHLVDKGFTESDDSTLLKKELKG